MKYLKIIYTYPTDTKNKSAKAKEVVGLGEGGEDVKEGRASPAIISTLKECFDKKKSNHEDTLLTTKMTVFWSCTPSLQLSQKFPLM